MKKLLFAASVAALALSAGCATEKSSGNMGVVSESKKDSCCSSKQQGGDMGVVSEKSCADKSEKSCADKSEQSCPKSKCEPKQD